MGRPPKKVTIEGSLVPAGSVRRNQENRYGHLTSSERWVLIIEECARIVAMAAADATKKRERPSGRT